MEVWGTRILGGQAYLCPMLQKWSLPPILKVIMQGIMVHDPPLLNDQAINIIHFLPNLSLFVTPMWCFQIVYITGFLSSRKYRRLCDYYATSYVCSRSPIQHPFCWLPLHVVRCARAIHMSLSNARSVDIRTVCVMIRGVSPIIDQTFCPRCENASGGRQERRSCLIDMLASPAERGSASCRRQQWSCKKLVPHAPAGVQLTDLAVPTCAVGL